MALSRRLAALPLLALVAACSSANWAEDEGNSTSNLSADGPDKGDEIGGAGSSVAYGPCRGSRTRLMGQVSTARRAAITRGFEWLDANVPFSMAGRREGYRTDCSGFVSMCLELSTPGQTTSTFGTSGSGTHRLPSYEDLVPADALVDAGHHSFIFLGWNDTNHSGMCVLEQSSTKNDMQFRVRMASSLKSEGFVAVRADKFRNDTRFNDISGGGGAGTDTGEIGEDGLEADNCGASSVSIRDVCTRARTNRGLECGRVTDECGRVVNCSVLPEFACADEGDTCELNRCKRCVAQPPVDVCNAAKTKSGVECGSIKDECGGTVNCDSVPGFACADGKKCGLVNSNKCADDPNAPKPADPSQPTEDQSKPSNTDQGDVGDEGDTNENNDDKTKDNGGTKDPTAAAKKPKTSSGGCSTAPASSSSSSSNGLGILIALGAIASIIRRRR
jgi:MYXO-CTERM domain-containing protein